MRTRSFDAGHSQHPPAARGRTPQWASEPGPVDRPGPGSGPVGASRQQVALVAVSGGGDERATRPPILSPLQNLHRQRFRALDGTRRPKLEQSHDGNCRRSGSAGPNIPAMRTGPSQHPGTPPSTGKSPLLGTGVGGRKALVITRSTTMAGDARGGTPDAPIAWIRAWAQA